MTGHNSPRRDTSQRSAYHRCSDSREIVNDMKRKPSSDAWTIKRLLCGQKLPPDSERVLRLTYLYGCLHGATDQLLPACFKSLEKDMGFTPQYLGVISSAARSAHVLACPIWGCIIDCCARRRIFSLTALGWGASASAILYLTEQWHVLLLLCSLGTFMSAMGPLSQKVIAQEVPENERGRTFGMLHFFQSFGRIVASLITTSISGFMIWGIEGWRHAFAMFGLLSILVGIIFATFITDCPHQRKEHQEKGRWSPLHDISYVFSNGSVWVMLLMGILNGVPRSAIHFSTMYFQYCNIADWWASFIVSASWIAAMIVAPAIGFAGDYIHSNYPHHGRQCLAQICIIARCVFMTIMLTCVPRQANSLWIFILLAIVIGLLAGWPGVGVNRPILAEIVRPEHRATTFALVSCLEGVGAAALGAPMVGYLCENTFGYVKIAHGKVFSHPSEEIRLKNARAISLAMLCMTVGPWMLNVLAYGVLHMTYKFDSHNGSASSGVVTHSTSVASNGELQSLPALEEGKKLP